MFRPCRPVGCLRFAFFRSIPIIVLVMALPSEAQVTLVEKQWQGLTVPFNSPTGDDYPFEVQDSGNIKTLGWWYVSTGWRDLHFRYTLPSGVFFDQKAGEPWVPVTQTLGEESAGYWNLKLLENQPGPTHVVDTGLFLVIQRHADPNLPVTGWPVSELAGLDNVMLDFMRQYGMEAGTLVVVKDRGRIYERGFGWQDRERTVPIKPTAVMRLATVTFMFTARGIRELVEDGMLDLNERAFDVLGIPPLLGFPITDSRVMDITVGQLLDHTSGMPDQAPSPREIGDLVGIARAARGSDVRRGVGRNGTLEETIAYMWSTTLPFDPGSENLGSHWGYQILGKVIETRSGMSYDDYIHLVVGEDNGMPTPRQARDTAQDAYPDEIWYAGEWFVHDANDYFLTGPQVEQSYSIDFGERPGAGAVIASARDCARFTNLFFVNGIRKPPDLAGIVWSTTLYGSLPGTTSIVHDSISPDGSSLAWVALLNERVDGVDCNGILANAINSFLGTVVDWPKTPMASRRRF